ncbi:hypothetical protein FNV43_RR13093 [Rhamnella rubrinervis]|uniref:Uncharacterized protein n=1 Tax=Rhamnella rubrinervis TaxID=2594499 RepID=A0A8K0H0G0_9ROSA|nr:hypothetical protein FNV43_RR13093 [Rhamnella rubrinervis]
MWIALVSFREDVSSAIRSRFQIGWLRFHRTLKVGNVSQPFDTSIHDPRSRSLCFLKIRNLLWEGTVNSLLNHLHPTPFSFYPFVPIPYLSSHSFIFSFPDLHLDVPPSPELDDLSWLHVGAPLYKGQIVLSDSKVEAEGVEIEASSSVPAGGEADDVVMIDGIRTQVAVCERRFGRPSCAGSKYRVPRGLVKVEWPTIPTFGENVARKVSVEPLAAAEEVDPSVVDAIKNIKAGKCPASEPASGGNISKSRRMVGSFRNSNTIQIH